MNKFKCGAEEVLIADFSDVCKNAKIIGFNDTVIDVKGVVTFHRVGSRNKLDKLFDSPSRNVEIDETTFNTMVETLKTLSVEPQNIVTESKTKPVQTLVINMDALKNDLMISYQDGETITINNFVFTSSIMNFHGEALNPSQQVFYLGFDELSKLKSYVFSASKN